MGPLGLSVNQRPLYDLLFLLMSVLSANAFCVCEWPSYVFFFFYRLAYSSLFLTCDLTLVMK